MERVNARRETGLQIFRRVLLLLTVRRHSHRRSGACEYHLQFQLACLLSGGGSTTLVVALYYNVFAGGVLPASTSIDAMAVIYMVMVMSVLLVALRFVRRPPDGVPARPDQALSRSLSANDQKRDIG